MPGWLAQVIVGLVKSDHVEAERRLTPAQAMALLQVEGVARAWNLGPGAARVGAVAGGGAEGARRGFRGGCPGARRRAPRGAAPGSHPEAFCPYAFGFCGLIE